VLRFHGFIAAFVLAACAPQGVPPRLPRPTHRDITLTTVPVLVKEMRRTLPFLADAFGPTGALHEKELYGFMPSQVTVMAGDTIHFTFINPEDDVHAFVLPDLAVSLPGNSTTRATYIALRAGVFAFTCAIQSHLPMMAGQLIVLAPAALASSAASERSGP